MLEPLVAPPPPPSPPPSRFSPAGYTAVLASQMAHFAILTLTRMGDSGRMEAGSANGRGPGFGVIEKEFSNK